MSYIRSMLVACVLSLTFFACDNSAKVVQADAGAREGVTVVVDADVAEVNACVQDAGIADVQSPADVKAQ